MPAHASGRVLALEAATRLPRSPAPAWACAHSHRRVEVQERSSGGRRAQVHALRKRFQLHLSEAQCVEVVLGMIADSLDAWRTRQYDYYQRVLNGIL